jgi:hypothetical protein
MIERKLSSDQQQSVHTQKNETEQKRGQPKARAEVKEPLLKYICI